MDCAIFGLWLVLIAIGLVLARAGKSFQPPPDGLPDGFRGLGLAVEFVATPREFDALVGDPGTERGIHNRRRLRLDQWLDFGMIAAYLGLFWLLGELEGASTFAGAASCGAIARSAILLAAVFDIGEDLRILRWTTKPSGAGIRRYGATKWCFYFLASAALSPLFLLPAPGSALHLFVGAPLLLGGLLGLVALLRQDDARIENCFTVTTFGLALYGLIALQALCSHP